MKNSQFSLVLLTALTGCADVSSDSEMPSGTYIRAMQSEYSKAADTVFVKAQADGWVEVVHRTRYQRIGEQPGESQQKSINFMARYDLKKNECINPKTGSRYNFPPNSKTLIYNGASYMLVP